nr:MAG TPA: hypothetical protein [Caudoviricetes sp.]
MKINLMSLFKYFIKINNTFVCLQRHKRTTFYVVEGIVTRNIANTFQIKIICKRFNKSTTLTKVFDYKIARNVSYVCAGKINTYIGTSRIFYHFGILLQCFYGNYNSDN